jgi:hypothetical protein
LENGFLGERIPIRGASCIPWTVIPAKAGIHFGVALSTVAVQQQQQHQQQQNRSQLSLG